MSLVEEALLRAGLCRGMRLLDVATGTGDLSIAAARAGARVLAIDNSPTAIARLRARAGSEGLNNIEGYVMDGRRLAHDDDAFDIVASQAGRLLLPDRHGALSEMARVTKPGGRVVVTAHGPSEQVEELGYLIAAVEAVLPGSVSLDPRRPNPDGLAEALVGARLGDIRVQGVTSRMEFVSGKHLWDEVVNRDPIGASAVATLTPEQRSLVQDVLDGMLREHSGGKGNAVLTARHLIGVGTRRTADLRAAI